MKARSAQVDSFYALLGELEQACGGKRRLSDCHGRMEWPHRGVYFFFEDGELREDGISLRVVRVGTHALRPSKSTLWGRLAQHKGCTGGTLAGGGNHRGSIFRGHVGAALLASRSWPPAINASWQVGSSATAAVRRAEHALERAVSNHIGAMTFLWLAVDDAADSTSARGVIETGSIGLLSNLDRAPIDPASPQWLGRHARAESIRGSGLWNVNHVRGAAGTVLDALAYWGSTRIRVGLAVS